MSLSIAPPPSSSSPPSFSGSGDSVDPLREDQNRDIEMISKKALTDAPAAEATQSDKKPILAKTQKKKTSGRGRPL
jgi:hypothetical protein